MTQGFHAEPAVVVQLLNAALALETRCVLRDKQCMPRDESINSVKRKAELTRHATAEQRHADQLMHRIVQLGGEPNVSPEDLLKHSYHEYSEEHSPDWSTEDLMAERLVMESYREMIVYIGNDDPRTRRLLVNIVNDEAKHVAELARRLGWLTVSAPFSSVLSWRTAFLIRFRKIMSTLLRMRLPSARGGVHALGGTHEQYTGCTSDKQRHQVCEPSSGTFHGVSRTICPVESCSREMTRDTSRFDGGHDSLSGLDHVYCPSCGHMGMVPSGKVQILFCTARQYVVAYGPSPSTITVVLTARAAAAYQAYALRLDDLAKLVAEWALLSGFLCSTVTLTPERQEFIDFERYLRGHVLRQSSLRVA